jgi:hypothetical protein
VSGEAEIFGGQDKEGCTVLRIVFQNQQNEQRQKGEQGDTFNASS